MASFEYLVIDQRGKEKKGSMEGSSAEKVTALIKAEGWIPLSVKEQNILTRDINLDLGSGVKSRDLCVFCRQFTSILGAGVTVINALQMLGEQTQNKILRNAINEVQASVEKGETLANSMRVHSKIFPAILINMVEAGEAFGSLEISFERMAKHFEKENKLKGLIKQAMIYPIIVCVVAVIVIVLMMNIVIPNFQEMFDEIDTELPAITKMVIAMSNFMVKYWWVLLSILITLIVGVIFFKRSEYGSQLFGRIGLKMPLFGSLAVKSASARLARTLSTLIAAGIPLIEGLDITAKTMDNVIVKQCLLNAKEEVAKGVPLSKPLEYSGIFPPMVFQMVKIGEETGSLEDMLDKVADYYEEEVEVASKSLTTILEPLIIVILAVIIGAIVMSILSPMLSMYDALDKA
ncbi:MAG TPA: type II secretion system F family protein [Lachnospiraceae bacterium]|nr:type II secretion system F family protein [Lachnospiraceae bacterium]